jgi:prevent-host-death family protein
MAEPQPREITQRELRNGSGSIMRGIERGESFTITRNGTPIGRLIPLRRRICVPRAEVLAAFSSAPMIDPDRLRADLDENVDQDPFNREW